MASNEPPLVFVTDCEGNLDVLQRALLQSGVVDSDGTPTRPFRFVFGGDATTRGRHDLRLLQYLDRLQQHPLCAQFFALLGNRELMLFRLTDALHWSRLTQPLHPHSFFWLPVSGDTALPLDAEEKFYRTTMSAGNDVVAALESLEELRARAADWLREHSSRSSSFAISYQTLMENCPLQSVFDTLALVRLHTMLHYTMGSPTAFEYRRQELHDLGLNSSDVDVMRSFLDMVKPDGLVMKYCLGAQIGHLDEASGTLFVHGSLSSADILRTIFERSNVDVPLKEWVDAYNCEARAKFFEYQQQFHHRQQLLFDYYCQHGGVPLPSFEEQGGFGYSPVHDLLIVGMNQIQRGVPSSTPIYSAWTLFYKPNVPLRLDPYVSRRLREANIRTAVCGHNPHGDGTMTLRFDEDADVVSEQEEQKFEKTKYTIRVHVVDNCYAANTRFISPPLSSSSSLSSAPFVKLAASEDPRGSLSAAAFCLETVQSPSSSSSSSSSSASSSSSSLVPVLLGSLSNGQQYRVILDETINPSSRFIGRKVQLKKSSSSSSAASAESSSSSDQVQLIVKLCLGDGTFLATETAGYTVVNYRIRLSDDVDADQSVVEWLPW